MATTNIQSFAGDVEVSGELTVTGQLNSTTGSDKVKLTATTASETDYIPLSKGTTGAQPLYTDSNLTYNPADNVIGANVSGNAAFATNATYATNAGQLGGRAYSEVADASTIASRNAGGHLYMVYGFSEYLNMSHAAVQRNADTIFYSSNDDYLRKTNAAGMRSSLNVPTRTGGDASGTWSINVNGNAAFATNATYATSAGSATNATYANSAGSATNATFATNATHANNANTVAFTDRDTNNETDYIAFVANHTAGDKALYTDSNLTYNPSSNYLNANVPYANQAGYVSGGICKYYYKYVTTQRKYPNSTNVHVYDMDFNYAAERSNSTLIIEYSIFYEATNNRNFVPTVNGSYYPYNMSDVRFGIHPNQYDVDIGGTPSLARMMVHYAPGTTANRTYRIYNRSSTNTSQGFSINRAWNVGPQNHEYGISYALVQEYAA